MGPGEQGWRSGEGSFLPPMWHGFDSQTPVALLWAEVVLGSLPAPRGFSRYSSFPLSSKTNILKLQSISSPEYLWLFVSRWSPGEIMEFLWIFFEFFDWLFAEQEPIKKFKKYSKKFCYPRVSPGDQPLTKKPEDSGLENEFQFDPEFGGHRFVSRKTVSGYPC